MLKRTCETGRGVAPEFLWTGNAQELMIHTRAELDVLDSIVKQIVGASVHMPCDRDTLVLTWTLRPISSELFINPG